MVCLGLKPWGAEWKTQTNQLSYGGTPTCSQCYKTFWRKSRFPNIKRLKTGLLRKIMLLVNSLLLNPTQSNWRPGANVF